MSIWLGLALVFGTFFYRAADFEKFERPLLWSLLSVLLTTVSFHLGHGLLGILMLQIGLFVAMAVVRHKGRRRGVGVPRDG